MRLQFYTLLFSAASFFPASFNDSLLFRINVTVTDFNVVYCCNLRQLYGEQKKSPLLIIVMLLQIDASRYTFIVNDTCKWRVHDIIQTVSNNNERFYLTILEIPWTVFVIRARVWHKRWWGKPNWDGTNQICLVEIVNGADFIIFMRIVRNCIFACCPAQIFPGIFHEKNVYLS